MPEDDHPKTCSKSKQAVEDEPGTLPPTTEHNLVTGDASNKTNPTTNTTTLGPTTAAATTAATANGDNSTSQGSSRTTETVWRTLFSPTNTAEEAAIGNKETERSESERSESDKEQDPTDRNNSNNNTATMVTAAATSPFDAELQDILERLCKFDLNCTPPHNIVEGLTNRGYFTWDNLQMMDDAEIDALYKIDGTRRVPLLGNTSTKLRKLVDFVDENRVNNVPDCFLTSTYNPENLKEY